MNKETQKINIKVKSEYLTKEYKSDKNVFLFKYDVSIYNNMSSNVQLLTRHWKISDALGNTQTVNGEGVIGKKPIINSGLSFEYTSFCPLKTEFGKMEGSYTFKDESSGDLFEVGIPEFILITNKSIN
tara:strand:+ start:2000 stop:2383 length:384 start_codon:yes stop_codon:yes gene_type:complete